MVEKYIKQIRRIGIRLRKRHQTFTTNYLGFSCRVIDKSSFLYMCDEIFERGIYKFPTENPSPYILDCGANIGLATIYLKKLYPEAEIVAFEPDPMIAGVFKENIKSANCDNDVTCVQACVAAQSGEVTFYTDHADGGSAVQSGNQGSSITVPKVPLRDYFNKPVDLLKIDIEGAEYEVLASIKDRLNGIKNIFVEYHSFLNEEQHLGEILSFLSNAGFRYYIEPGGSSSVVPFVKIENYNNMDMQVNIFGYRDH